MGRRLIFDWFSQQALQTLHRYRAVMFSPTCRITIKKNVIRLVCKKKQTGPVTLIYDKRISILRISLFVLRRQRQRNSKFAIFPFYTLHTDIPSMLPGYIHHIVQSQTETGYFLLPHPHSGYDAFKLIKYNLLSRKRNTDSIIPHP